MLKDDLLVKIEELSNEQEILREQVDSLQTVRTRMQTKYAFVCSFVPWKEKKTWFRLAEVEEELRKTREELEKKKEEEVNCSMHAHTSP